MRRTIVRTLVSLATTLAVAVAAMAPAGADSRPHLALDPDVGPPTIQTTAVGKGFEPGETVELRFDKINMIGSAMADRLGKIQAEMMVPAPAEPGVHVVEARGVSSGIIASRVFLVRTDWAQFHFDAGRIGFNPFENVLSPGSVSGITIQLRKATSGAIVGSPVYCGGLVYAGSSDGNVYASPPPDGDFVWVFATRGPVVSSPAAIGPEPCKVIVGSMDGNVYALDGASRRLLWSSDAGAPIAAPLLAMAEGSLVVGDLNGVLHAFDLNGNRLWATQLDGPISGAAAFLNPPPDQDAPAPAQIDPGNRIYVGTERGTLYSLNPADGRLAFAVTLDGPIVSAPAVVRGFPKPGAPPKVFVGTTAGTLYALFADDGTKVWSFRTGGPITGTPGFIMPCAFIGSGDGKVYDIEEVDGRPVPSWIASVGSPVNTSLALANGVLYFGADDSKLHALDAGPRVVYERGDHGHPFLSHRRGRDGHRWHDEWRPGYIRAREALMAEPTVIRPPSSLGEAVPTLGFRGIGSCGVRKRNVSIDYICRMPCFLRAAGE
jgi:outer membrane protein assembly factor BamB